MNGVDLSSLSPEAAHPLEKAILYAMEAVAIQISRGRTVVEAQCVLGVLTDCLTSIQGDTSAPACEGSESAINSAELAAELAWAKVSKHAKEAP